MKIDAKAIAELYAIDVKAPKKKTKLKFTMIPKVSDKTEDKTGISSNNIVINKKDKFNLAFKETYLDIGYIRRPKIFNPFLFLII